MNIILIGMPSSGKSTIGKALAEKLGMRFIDTDALMLEKVKKPLKEVVNHEGLQRFLEIQNETVTGLAVDNAVVSTGGSCIYNENAMVHLRKSGRVFFLKLSIEELEARISSERRFARKEDQSFADLYNERTPLYQKFSDTTIECSGKSEGEIVSEIEAVVSN